MVVIVEEVIKSGFNITGWYIRSYIDEARNAEEMAVYSEQNDDDRTPGDDKLVEQWSVSCTETGNLRQRTVRISTKWVQDDNWTIDSQT